MTELATPDTLIGLSVADRREVTLAYGKLLRKESLSRKEQAVMARFERDREERLRWQYYRTIPKKHWQRMSGRQVKVINEQAARYGLPIGGPAIDLSAFVMAFHDFLAKNAVQLAREEDELLQYGHNSPALGRYRDEKARLAQLDRREREGELLPAREVYRIVERLAYFVRTAGVLLQRNFGNEALDILTDALDQYEALMREEFSSEVAAANDVPEPTHG
jgi:hypothetical protein